MEKHTKSHSSPYEQTVIKIMRKLPPDRISELVDFARFLEQIARRDEKEEEAAEMQKDISPGEEKWDQLLARPEAKRAMREMAREAREDYHAGRTTDIAVTDDGYLAPI